jgi:hypothetical protein
VSTYRHSDNCLWVLLLTTSVGGPHTYGDGIFRSRKSALQRARRLKRDPWFQKIRPDVYDFRVEPVPFRTSRRVVT